MKNENKYITKPKRKRNKNSLRQFNKFVSNEKSLNHNCHSICCSSLFVSPSLDSFFTFQFLFFSFCLSNLSSFQFIENRKHIHTQRHIGSESQKFCFIYFVTLLWKKLDYRIENYVVGWYNNWVYSCTMNTFGVTRYADDNKTG